ncbi:asparaginase [Nocardia wallacei]|uniref:asparaginase n=1 Tax=Nocardia wallacei TaxID=480035 RepID=UPI002454A918|nr:asparaginase [Nocardia wallacei]
MSNPDRFGRVVVFGLGGTIAMTPTDSGGVAPNLTAEQLVAAVPGLDDTGVKLDVVQFRQIPGASLSFADIAALQKAISMELPHAAGVVVTQGTDTIEETSYLLDLLHDRPEPVVVTGAMRNPSMAGADGPANLLAAVQVAASPQAREQGCVVVFADEIHAARRVRKAHTTCCAAFESPNGGPLGWISEGHVHLANRLSSRTWLPAPPTDNVRVALLPISLGDDGTILDSVADHVDGIVVAAVGAGHVPAPLAPRLGAIADTKPVILASRTGGGTVLAKTYGFPGSERDLLARGLISAGFLDPVKARLLLHTLICNQIDRDTIASAFAASGGYADPTSWPWATLTAGADNA